MTANWQTYANLWKTLLVLRKIIRFDKIFKIQINYFIRRCLEELLKLLKLLKGPTLNKFSRILPENFYTASVVILLCLLLKWFSYVQHKVSPSILLLNTK